MIIFRASCIAYFSTSSLLKLIASLALKNSQWTGKGQSVSIGRKAKYRFVPWACSISSVCSDVSCPSLCPNNLGFFFNQRFSPLSGFESFVRNDIEQLLINLANEALQDMYCKQVLIAESNLYKSEGLRVDDFHFEPNSGTPEAPSPSNEVAMSIAQLPSHVPPSLLTICVFRVREAAD